MPINTEIDLSGVCHAVRDQGARATCLACATSDAHAMEHSCAALSAEFLFYHAIKVAKVGNLADGILFEEAAQALAKEGQPVEQEWPYSPVQPSAWIPPEVTNIWRGTLNHEQANAINAISALVRSGRPVVLGIQLSAAFLAPDALDHTISAAGSGFAGHAVLVVGLGRDATNSLFFRVRNSWGGAWADGGYAWLQADYLADKLIGFAAVTTK